MSKKSVSDSYLNKLWRKAVLAEWGYECPYCGNTDIDIIEIHHIVKRKNKILRWDYRNGIPGCKYSCHSFYHTLSGQKWILENLEEEVILYLSEFDNVLYKDYLFEHGLTDNEFRKIKLEELKKVIDDN